MMSTAARIRTCNLEAMVLNLMVRNVESGEIPKRRRHLRDPASCCSSGDNLLHRPGRQHPAGCQCVFQGALHAHGTFKCEEAVPT